MQKMTVLISGASKGIGEAAAMILSKNGHMVYGTSRVTKGIKTICEYENGGFFKLIQLDVTDQTSIDAALEIVKSEEGSIDCLINNAGMGISSPIEETVVSAAKEQFDTNFFGMHMLTKAILPIMRAAGRGRIIFIGSVAGRLTVPYQTFYCASKAAMEAYAAGLSLEVKPYDIRVSLIMPGDTKTGFTDSRKNYFINNSVYSTNYKKSIEKMENDERNGDDPILVAKMIKKAVEAKNPRPLMVPGLFYKAAILMGKFMPARFMYYILYKMYG